MASSVFPASRAEAADFAIISKSAGALCAWEMASPDNLDVKQNRRTQATSK
jgi:hypothetical protein